MTNLHSRRAFIQTSVLGLGAVGTRSAALSSAVTNRPASPVLGSSSVPPEMHGVKPPGSDIAVWITNDKQRFSAGPSIPWQPTSKSESTDSVRVLASNKSQDILGFSGCFSDAACYVINQLRAPAREELLHEMFDSGLMGLNARRTCSVSADSATEL